MGATRHRFKPHSLQARSRWPNAMGHRLHLRCAFLSLIAMHATTRSGPRPLPVTAFFAIGSWLNARRGFVRFTHALRLSMHDHRKAVKLPAPPSTERRARQKPALMPAPAEPEAVVELQQSLKVLQSIHDSSPDALLQLGADGIVLTASQSSAHVFGSDPTDLVGKLFQELLPGSCSEDFDELYTSYRTSSAEGRKPCFTESYVLRPDGTTCPVEIALGHIPGLEQCTAFVRDISRRRRLEAELLRVATDERRRLAMDLHDSLCQQISAIHFSLSAVSNHLIASDHTLAASVKKITLMVSAALDDARQIAHGLSPVMQDGDDIVRAVRRLVRNIEDLCQTQCRMHATQVFDDLHPDVASQLYHIAQEALNNVLRHAGATRIEVTLARENHDVVLTVSDNGIGLSALTNQDAGRGIRFMRYRAGTIHGSLTLVRKKEGGMAVVCRVPYRTS